MPVEPIYRRFLLSNLMAAWPQEEENAQPEVGEDSGSVETES